MLTYELEITANALQTVSSGGNVLFTETPVAGCRGDITHREGSGIVNIRGITDQCRARYRISFGGNITIADGGTAEAISVALALEGEALASATAIVTPAAVGDLSSVFVAVFIEVPRGCCYTVSLKNTSTQAINVQNANLIVERVA